MLLCAPHTLTYIAWKKRHVEEESFVTMAEGRGFVVDQVRCGTTFLIASHTIASHIKTSSFNIFKHYLYFRFLQNV